MKKFLAISLCLLTVITMASCRKNNTKNGSSSNESSADSQTQSPSTTKDGTYKDIVCAKIETFKEVSFSQKGNETVVFIKLPKEWTLKKSGNGYNIIKNSQTIGSVTTSVANNANTVVNLFKQEIAIKDMKVVTSIDNIGSESEPSYTRTICYNYDAYGKSQSLILTFNYKDADSSAVYEMMSTATKQAPPQKNMGVLPLDNNRKRVLIIGNSFVSTSNVGGILQTMCGSKLIIEPHSVGMATLRTHTKDGYTLQNIRSGQYAAVFACGLFNELDVNDLRSVITACKDSGTKLAIFPAHNENRTQIDKAATLYPDTVLLDWKAEINALIDLGIDKSYFCIADEHKHSTPLAGYVGAHMIYRAIFNEIPEKTNVPGVLKSEINLLGDYPKTGKISLPDKTEPHVIG